MNEESAKTPLAIELPAPTAWPVALAFGLTLVFAGMLTTASLSILGAIVAVCGYVGWFRDVLPREKHESVSVTEAVPPVVTGRPRVARVGWITHDVHRAHLPVETYPVSAGVKGGLAGSVAMAALAMTYGIIGPHSIWYPINLLSAGFFPRTESTFQQLSTFHWDSFLIAAIVHIVTSVLVGLLYGAMLPMLPRHPILLGGVIAPILWSGLIHSVLEFLNPVLSERINWLWFVLSQVGFGLVAGFIVARQQRVPTWQNLPFPVRAGFEAPGVMNERNEGDPRP
jgi:hypothetical protein